MDEKPHGQDGQDGQDVQRFKTSSIKTEQPSPITTQRPCQANQSLLKPNLNPLKTIDPQGSKQIINDAHIPHLMGLFFFLRMLEYITKQHLYM